MIYVGGASMLQSAWVNEGVVEVLPLPELSPFETKKMEEVGRSCKRT
jgi:hypothetical protein